MRIASRSSAEKMYLLMLLMWTGFEGVSTDGHTQTAGVTRAVYENLTNIRGISTLLTSPKYPFSPSRMEVLDSFNAPLSDGDMFGQRLTAFFEPKQDGDHVFVMSCDDYCQLFFSNSTDYNKKDKLLDLTRFTRYKQLEGSGMQQKSRSMMLKAGSRYLLEAIMVEYRSIDHLTVGVILPDNTLLHPITSDYLTVYTRNGADEMLANLESMNTEIGQYASLEDAETQTNGSFSSNFFANMDKVMDISTAPIWKSEISVADAAINTMDSFYELALKSTSETQHNSKSQLFIKEHFQVTEMSTSGVVFPRSASLTNNSFTVPKSGLNNDTTAVGAIYSHLHDVMPAVNDILGDSGKGEFFIASEVISCSTKPGYRYSPSLLNPVIITIETTKPGINPKCVFWKLPKSSAETGKWSEDGCSVVSTSAHKTTCKCNHMTHFAILMQPVELPESVTKEHGPALKILTYIGCTLSLFGVLATLITYTLLRMLTRESINIHANLCIAIAFTQILLVVTFEATKSRVVCQVVASLLHFFSLGIFSWMLCEGILLYRKIVRVIVVSSMKLSHQYCIGWGGPMVIVVVTLAIQGEQYVDDESCWLSITYATRWAFIGPALAVTMINTIILGLTLKMFLGATITEQKSALKKVRSSLRAFVVLMPLLGVTWVFGVFAVNSETVVFQYIFIILNSTQGIFVFCFHCYGNQEVINEFTMKKNRIYNRSTRTTLSRSPNRSMEEDHKPV